MMLIMCTGPDVPIFFFLWLKSNVISTFLNLVVVALQKRLASILASALKDKQ